MREIQLDQLSTGRIDLRQSFSDVRCNRCGRLLLRWVPKGLATISVKCPRCGMLDTVQLSTG